MSARTADAVIVGSGPNGLTAALTLARAGLAVHIYEGAETAGGGCRTEALTLPGFSHDVCSTVHPLLAASPFFARAALNVSLREPQVAFAHPLDGGRAAVVVRSVQQTAAALGADARAYRRLMGPLVSDAQAIVESVLAPLLAPPRHPFAMARFGLAGLLPLSALSRRFESQEARALLAGLGAHSMRLSAHPARERSRSCSACWPTPSAGRVVEGGSAGGWSMRCSSRIEAGRRAA